MHANHRIRPNNFHILHKNIGYIKFNILAAEARGYPHGAPISKNRRSGGADWDMPPLEFLPTRSILCPAAGRAQGPTAAVPTTHRPPPPHRPTPR